MANEDPMQDALDRHRRVQPYIARMGRAIGFLWMQLSNEARDAINGHVDGSPGLDSAVIEWALEFDEVWEAREAIVKIDDFDDQIAAFTDAKIKTLIALARLSPQ